MRITQPNPRSGEAISGRWELVPQRSGVGFRVRLPWSIATVTDRFDEFRGRFDLSATPAVVLTIKAAGVQTGNRMRDRHLRSSDFLDAENHPEVRFVSVSATLESDTLKVSGRLVGARPVDPAQGRRADRSRRRRAPDRGCHHRATRELGMTSSLFRLIPSRSELFVNARLIPARQTPHIHAAAYGTEPN